MICRIWRGWTTPQNAAAYEEIVRGEVIPEIEARQHPRLSRDRPDATSARRRRRVRHDHVVRRHQRRQELRRRGLRDRPRPSTSTKRPRRFDERSVHYEILDQGTRGSATRAGTRWRRTPRRLSVTASASRATTMPATTSAMPRRRRRLTRSYAVKITGGTGLYRHAHGTVLVKSVGNNSDLTIKVSS